MEDLLSLSSKLRSLLPKVRLDDRAIAELQHLDYLIVKHIDITLENLSFQEYDPVGHADKLLSKSAPVKSSVLSDSLGKDRAYIKFISTDKSTVGHADILLIKSTPVTGSTLSDSLGKDTAFNKFISTDKNTAGKDAPTQDGNVEESTCSSEDPRPETGPTANLTPDLTPASNIDDFQNQFKLLKEQLNLENFVIPSDPVSHDSSETMTKFFELFDLPRPEKRFKCDRCEYKTDSTSLIIKHRRVHTGEKPFACTKCDYRSKQQSGLASHLLTHLKEKPHKCNKCEYCANSSKTLKSHMHAKHGKVVKKPHMSVKMEKTEESEIYKCNYCSYSTRIKMHMTKHINIHTRETSFQCGYEGCTFISLHKVSLNSHVKCVHEKQKNAKCSQCDFRSFRKSDVKKHELTHNSVKALQCTDCDYGCNRKSNLTMHMKKRHPYNF